MTFFIKEGIIAQLLLISEEYKTMSTMIRKTVLMTSLSLFFIHSVAFAQPQTLGYVSSGLTDVASLFSKFIMAAAFAIGFGFMLAGVLKYKSHRNNPSATPLSVPIFYFIFGIMLLLIVVLITLINPHVFGMTGGTLAMYKPTAV